MLTDVCGVIGLVYRQNRNDLGHVAAELLKTLEYRGYDSTGGAFQGDGEDVRLRKAVGAPSAMVGPLGITGERGRAFCGQVRWATFGAVTDENSQPHVVRCKAFLYGAHNGNLTNCDALKTWLESEGHTVASDNDGEMLVHTVEHFFARELAGAPPRDSAARRAAMRRALIAASVKVTGSFAAVIVDPVTRLMWAIKQGSSLYFGLGQDGPGGPFAIASSDLSSVLKLTHELVPMHEGEFMEYDAESHQLYAVEALRVGSRGGAVRYAPGDRIERAPVKSRLKAADAALVPPFETFMDQEISAQAQTVRDVVSLFLDSGGARPAGMDADEAREYREAVARFVDLAVATVRSRGRLYAICCGSSFHAAKAASLFFDELAGVEFRPLLPGEFRGEVSRALADDDLVVTISQSGETKDVIDVLNDVIASGKRVVKVALVNNVNSTIAMEKCDVLIPLRCGPEIAVPATKSFMNQMVVLYCLALELARRLAAEAGASAARGLPAPALEARLQTLRRLPDLIRETIAATAADVEAAAELMYRRPSLHVLATKIVAVAKEGALKIREVVLNHAEGFEASEFKHGPNTILGLNTVIGLDQVEAMVDRVRRGLPPDYTANLRAGYPIVYVTGPDERDVALTVSQINTHKIRGAGTVVIAEPHPALVEAAHKPPADNPAYRSVCVTLPPTGDTLMTMFTSIVALQRLALVMSVRKQAYLDRLGITGHGVDPDAPKNVSKSITVD